MTVVTHEINSCAEPLNGIPRVEIILPGSDQPLGVCQDDDCRISVIPWLGKCADSLQLYPITESGNDKEPSAVPHFEDTVIGQEEYLEKVRNVIASCQSRGGKTVYSRIRKIDCPASAKEIFKAELFKAFPDTYRFSFYHPQIGEWIGASPELLFHYYKSTRRFSTMAIAGTRLRQNAGAWDKKNIEENDFVVRFIISSLESLGVKAEVSEPRTVAYGKIEHLCIDISGEMSAKLVYDAIDLLNPTPALCGTPRENAIKDIEAFEPHSRGCYGGIILYETAQEITAFVLLRCCRIKDDHALFYVGGGISALSDAETEWNETQAKAESLLAYMPTTQTTTYNQKNTQNQKA